MNLDGMMRDVLVRLELLSQGATQTWNKSGGESGEPDDRMVALVARGENPPHIRYRVMYNNQHTDAGRLAVLEEAQAELNAWVKRPSSADERVTDSKTFEEIVLADGEGWSVEAVAQHFNIAPAFVRRIRQRGDRGSEDGKPVIATPSDPAEKARELRAQGLTTRQIALNLKVHQTQVLRWTRAG